MIIKLTDNKIDFKKIPATLENPTRPSLYSFFKGLKKVLKRRFTERSEAIYLFKFIKKLKMPKSKSL